MTKQNYDYYKQELEKEQRRLDELNKEGARVLSRYDIEIAAGGDEKLALWTAKWLISNHIKYYKNMVREMRPEPRQISLFEI